MPIASLLRHILLSLVLTIAISQPAHAQGTQELRSLQQRLTDAKCYSGPIDGVMSSAVTQAAAQCPDMNPVLRIETGMHVAYIRQISVDSNCRMAVTGSDDKTVRMWSLPDGKLQRTLRAPIGAGNSGGVSAVAMSPDGNMIAAGGYDAYYEHGRTFGVYLFNASSGALTARLGVFESLIRHLAFSPDGHYLAAMLGDGAGLRVIDVKSGLEVGADREYGGQDSYGGVFAADGRLFTVSLDGYLRGYDRSFKLTAKVETKRGKQPYGQPFGVAIDPAGERLAVGFADSPKVQIYNASNLGFAFEADTNGIAGGDLASAAWSASGNRLVAGGIHINSSHKNSITVWEDGGRGKRSNQEVSDNVISDIVPCGDGFTVGAGDPLWAQLDAAGRITQSKGAVTADMRGKLGDAFRVSRDGSQVRFGLGSKDTAPVLFDLRRATLTENGQGDALASPSTDGINVAGWQNGNSPTLDTNVLPLGPFEMSRSLAAAPDGFVLGTEHKLLAFDRNGKSRWQKPAPGVAYGVNITGDGRLVVAAYADGTIRWHRMSDGRELLALFVNKNDKRWVAWTPSGYYQASPGGEDLFGWHVNRGWNQAADFFPASRFRERFARPDVVQKILGTLNEGIAVEEANRQANVRTDTSSVASRLPPVVNILSPVSGATVSGSEVTIEYELRSPSGLPVDNVEVQIDGRPTRGFQRVDANAVAGGIERRVISIPSKDVEIGLVARSGSLASDVASVQLKWAGTATRSGDDLLKPKLYGVVVGISKYNDATINLHYAAKDAKDFADALKTQQGGLYREVELKVLTDADATTGEIKRALTWLERSVTSRDVGLVFMAGHGVTDNKNRYYYLTADSDYKDPEDTALEGSLLRERTRSIAGKVLVFLDTCHAGQEVVTRGATDINAMVSELSSTENGVVTYASSTGRQLSMENDSWGNGAFTKALLEGLPALGRKGKADVTNKGVITTAALDLWLAERVKALTGGAQSPVMSRPPTVPDFPLFVAGK